MGFTLSSVFKVFKNTFFRQLDKVTGRGLDRVGRLAVKRARQLVSVSNPDGRSPSAPGEPPRMVTGRGRASINYTKSGKVVTLFADAQHMNLIDAGTSRVDPRPWKAILLQKHGNELGKAFQIR